MFDLCVSKVAYLDYLLVPSLQVVSYVNKVTTYRNLLPVFPLLTTCKLRPANIEGMVNTHWLTTIFEHIVKIINLLYRNTLVTYCEKNKKRYFVPQNNA